MPYLSSVNPDTGVRLPVGAIALELQHQSMGNTAG